MVARLQGLQCLSLSLAVGLWVVFIQGVPLGNHDEGRCRRVGGGGVGGVGVGVVASSSGGETASIGTTRVAYTVYITSRAGSSRSEQVRKDCPDSL